MTAMPPDLQDAVLVRRATAEDADELAALRWQWSTEAHRELGEQGGFIQHMADTVREYLGSGRWTIWIGVERSSNRLVGTAFLQRIDKVPRPYPRPPAWGYVTNVYVVPEHRNTGVGRRILDALIRDTREEGLDTLLLWPSQRAVPFYVRAGFRTPPNALELALDEDG
jgi:GNAT superfamily N-acetyltransferase